MKRQTSVAEPVMQYQANMAEWVKQQRGKVAQLATPKVRIKSICYISQAIDTNVRTLL